MAKRMTRQNRWNWEYLCVGALGVILLAIGFGVFRDYGISWDEGYHRKGGQLLFEYLFQGKHTYINDQMRFYGPAFSFPLVFVENIFHITDIRSAYLMRHFGTFVLFFISAFVFYLLCRRHFSNWKIAILGVLFLLISPRIFAETFFNPIDIPLMSFFIIGMYTMIRFLEERTYFWLILHAFASMLAINTRVGGLLIPVLTIVFLPLYAWPTDRRSFVHLIDSFVAYCLSVATLVVVFWPVLWSNPLENILSSVNLLKQFPWCSNVLYLGANVRACELPWHYNIVWMGVTIPSVILLLFLVGLIVVFLRPFRLALLNHSLLREWIVLLWLFVPIIIPIVIHSPLYDGWRHHYFVYPALVFIALVGFQFLWEIIRSDTSRWIRRPGSYLLVGLTGVSLFFVAFWMIRNHPHQNVYFNELMMDKADGMMELDYWGLSYKQGLEYVLSHDPREKVAIAVHEGVGGFNVDFLPEKSRSRLILTTLDRADYFLTYRRHHYDPYPYRLWYAVVVDSAHILDIYKLK